MKNHTPEEIDDIFQQLITKKEQRAPQEEAVTQPLQGIQQREAMERIFRNGFPTNAIHQ